MSAISSETRIRSSVGWVRWLANLPNGIMARWKRRETIKALQELNDHQLRDLGLKRHQIEDVVNGVANPDIARFR
jgi:uncharacterized protein YjiS (DUF1127 family)